MLALISLLILVPFRSSTAEAAIPSTPSQIQAYEDSYFYSYNGIESIGSSPLITYKQQSYLTIDDAASILGLSIDKSSGDIRFSGSPTLNTQQVVAGFLPKDPTKASDQFRINPAIGAQGAVVLEDDNPTPIFSKNQNQHLFPSSTQKIMTALLAIENGNLSDMVTVGPGAATVPFDSSKAGVLPGDRMTLEQLLYALMLPSGNDAAVAIAEHIAGSHQAFVKMMNVRARELGATRTHFENAHGYHHPRQVTTPADLALIAKEAAKHPIFKKVAGAPSYFASFNDRNGRQKSKMWRNTNALVRPDSTYFTSSVSAGKTGYTSASRHNLVSFASSNGHDYVVVLLRGERNQRYIDTRNLLHAAYSKRAQINRDDKTRMNVSPFNGRLFVNDRDMTEQVELFTRNGQEYVSIDFLSVVSPAISSVKASTNQQIKAALNGDLLSFDQVEPTIRNGRMLVPVRSFFERAGLHMHWDASTKTIEGRSADMVIRMQLDSRHASVNGQAVLLDVPATVESGRTLVPLRFISEVTGSQVDWGRGKTLFIY